jgi:mannose-6-phosphate isomerase
MKLSPPLKDYIWGGNRLVKEFGKLTNSSRVAESWELSCHKDGESVIINGDFAGLTLTELHRQNSSVFGEHCERLGGDFPLLIKLIDAKDNLSVQVHPDNEYARRVENENGKTEMWYVVDALPDSSLIFGFKEAISADEFRKCIESDSLLEVVNRVPVKTGDVFFIEAGTLHAIGAGILICEVQQNSNITYRVYDYGRLGADGRSRDLHILQALDVTLTKPAAPRPAGETLQKDGYSIKPLGKCEYFDVSLLNIHTKAALNADPSSFHALTFIEGGAQIGDVEAQKGDTLFIPAGMGEYLIKGQATVIFTKV